MPEWPGSAFTPGKGQGEGRVSFRKLVSPGGRSGGQMSQGGLQGLPQESGVERQGRGQAQPLGLSDLGRSKNVRIPAAEPSPPICPWACSERRGIQGVRTMEGGKDPLSNRTSLFHCLRIQADLGQILPSH